jgi:phospholipase C
VPALTLVVHAASSGEPRASRPDPGLRKIKHVVMILQENRSFDHYFGTFPGADGIPPGICVTDPRGGCVRPFHLKTDRNVGGPHALKNAVADIDDGEMDGFVNQAVLATRGCVDVDDPFCAHAGGGKDVMGYFDGRDIPNYWSYARNFVLQDHMFEPNASWSLPAHLFAVSAWSATCTVKGNPMSCRDAPNLPPRPPDFQGNHRHTIPDYAWTDLTYLLHAHHVSWRYYVFDGTEPDCEDDAAVRCAEVPQNAATPGIWNPLPWFDTVRENQQLDNITSIRDFYRAARRGRLPAVSWVVPTQAVSEHPPGLVSAGQAYVTSLVNAIMRGPDWSSTAIFVTWDDWGGFYDHVVPPRVDRNSYGLRVPGLVISPYAKRGFVDHQILSFDAYLKFVEDVFLRGQRLDPKNDGRPDTRPLVRENVPLLGDLAKDFDFHQKPRPPLVLRPYPNGRPARPLSRRSKS